MIYYQARVWIRIPGPEELLVLTYPRGDVDWQQISAKSYKRN